jgi:RNA polymerase sigma-70 factor (ECF subfamily)
VASIDASDEVLAARAQQDRSAFAELYGRYLGPVYRYMRYQAGPSDAEDLTAQVFFSAFRAAAQFRGDRGSSYKAWLFRIAHNTLSTWRRGRARAPVPVPELPESPDDCDPAVRADEAETSATLWSAVAELSPQDRELIELRYVEGMAHGEIADICGGSDGSIRVRIHRTLRKLRSSLEKKGVL